MPRAKIAAWKSAKRDDGEARRELVLRAATQRFNEVGYARASMAAIARQLGLSTNALYHYFDSKSDILLRCFERAFTLIDGCVDVAEAAPGNGNAKLRRFVAEVRALIESVPLPGSWLVVHLQPKDLTVVIARNAAQRKRLMATFRGGIADGSIRDCDVASTLAILLSGVYSLPYPTLVESLGTRRFNAELDRLVDRVLAP